MLEKPKGKTFERFPAKFEDIFREAWSDHADSLSILYSGTPALKTDFTRTGKRTSKGALMDGFHSIHRFYINNFTDGYNQDCLDFASGTLNSRKAEANLVPSKSGFINSFFIWAAFVSFFISSISVSGFLLLYELVHQIESWSL